MKDGRSTIFFSSSVKTVQPSPKGATAKSPAAQAPGKKAHTNNWNPERVTQKEQRWRIQNQTS
jgi:hypothetical protein